ncbi:MULTISPECIES: hypothetical protein [Microbacterium]|uniref:Uncharacterized protein n=1 Tax=Microbacterium barkeri TaxID=33917 RepID=A0A9W6H5F7_9MICO|nr:MULTISPECIES: hypothetical protein [Microbacterium]MDR6875682.1 hypothetical protein [Microbacterium barkeri]GLJ62314.1 hypothetical protein GCM10017576_24440 [Microbacterium barkeri]
MRKYLMGTGLLGAITSGYSLLKGSNDKRFTWRVALAWLSWAITLTLAIGEARDIRTASRGGAVPEDSPIAGKEYKYAGTPKPGKKDKGTRGRKRR